MNNIVVQAMKDICQEVYDATERCIHCRGDILCEPCELTVATVFDHFTTILNELEPDPVQRLDVALSLLPAHAAPQDRAQWEKEWR